jgi:hypothetical protein
LGKLSRNKDDSGKAAHLRLELDMPICSQIMQISTVVEEAHKMSATVWDGEIK